MGAIHDVMVDLRDGSPTRGGWVAFELSATNRRALYVPEGFAHGFQTLTDDAEVFYQMSVPYAPGAARGIDAFDPLLAIDWPLPVTVMSAADRALPRLAR
jgi:dTDP-4-dehydrorhamnose 3,5-epimerase